MDKPKKKKTKITGMKIWAVLLAIGVFYLYRELIWGGIVVYAVLMSITLGLRAIIKWFIKWLKEPFEITIRTEPKEKKY